MKCPTCQKIVANSCDLEAIEQTGECLSCDHVRADELSELEAVYDFEHGNL